MKAILSVLVFVAGFVAQGAINSKSNADCKAGVRGTLFGMGNTNPAPAKLEGKKPAPAPSQVAIRKSTTQGT